MGWPRDIICGGGCWPLKNVGTGMGAMLACIILERSGDSQR